MKLKTVIASRYLPLFALVLFLSGLASSDVSGQGFNFAIGDASVDLSSETGIAAASFTITLENPTDEALDIAGYSLLLDIGPNGRQLPTGVSFDTTTGPNDAVTYIAGNGTAPLIGASQETPGVTINFTPAAGDLGLGQIQFSNGSLAPGASADLLTVNLLIDRSMAGAGDFSIFLSPDGATTISTVSGGVQPFTSTEGTLSIVDSPPFLLGDVDRNGFIEFDDISAFISVLAMNEFQAEADTSQNGIVDFDDIGPFIGLLSSQ